MELQNNAPSAAAMYRNRDKVQHMKASQQALSEGQQKISLHMNLFPLNH